ncbi:MAG: MFS transporter [Carbonactinosporaceae bacterium]
MARIGALGLATLGFTINFWAWALIAPLAPTYRDLLDLSPLAVAAVVAVPVLVGSLGRIPVGALTDRYGGRRMFAAVSVTTVVPVLFLGFAGTSFAALIAGGFALGVAGTAFAVGVPFVNAWFPSARRGRALGVFGMGTAGTAVSAFVTPRIATAAGREAAYLTVAAALAGFATLALVALRDPQATPSPAQSLRERLNAASQMPVTWQLASLYAVTFGGFVAFSVYLPSYLENVYGLPITDAATRTAGFVVLAVLARQPAGRCPTASARYGYSRCVSG